jgi:hypothetical protein
VTDSASPRAVSRISQLCELDRWQEAAQEAGVYLQSSPDDARVLRDSCSSGTSEL